MLSQWTLSARVDASAVDFGLSDGRRLAVHVRRPVALLAELARSLDAAALLGDDLAGRLAASEPRPLSVLYDSGGPLDEIDWEHLRLGTVHLAEHFRLSRQLVSDADCLAGPDAAAADALVVRVVHGDSRWALSLGDEVRFDALERRAMSEAVAHVLLLDGVALGEFVERVQWPRCRSHSCAAQRCCSSASASASASIP